MEGLGQFSYTSVGFFLVFIALTLGITYWAARKTKSTREYYAAGGNITAGQNGFALAGDYMSAASFLGIAGLVSLKGFDGLIYSTGWLVGWPLVLFLIAEPLRNLGKYTFADVVAYRLRQRPVRLAAAFGTLITVTFYLIAQMVGAGNLIKLLFGIPYLWAVVIVGVVMLLYVLFGGMIATTWVQIIKAILLLGGAILLCLLVLAKYDFNPIQLFESASIDASVKAAEKASKDAADLAAKAAEAQAANAADAADLQKKADEAKATADGMNAPEALETAKTKMLEPGSLITSPWDAFSLGLALMFGTAGLPHILMRFYTVPHARAARKSVFYATGLIGFFYLLTFILGFGAMGLVGQAAIAAIDKGGNMAAPMLAWVVGGDGFLGFISAVAFATILAVVAGLTLAASAALAHDIWVSVVRGGQAPEKEQLMVARVASVAVGIIAVLLGIAFEGQNVAFMVGLAFAVAASANLPALLLSVFWRRCTTAGAVAAILVGTAAALILIYVSPTVQVDILKNDPSSVLFGLKNPAIVSIPLSFVAGILVSLARPEAAANEKYAELEQRVHFGHV
jgi:cation/acetate symporter